MEAKIPNNTSGKTIKMRPVNCHIIKPSVKTTIYRYPQGSWCTLFGLSSVWFSKTSLHDPPKIKITSLSRLHFHKLGFWFQTLFQLNNETTPVLRPILFRINSTLIIQALLWIAK